MVRNKSFGSVTFDVVNYIFLALVALVCLYPFWHVLASSFSDPVRLSAHTGALLWPTGYSLDGYRLVMRNPNVWRGYANTLFYVGMGTFIRMTLTIMGAYVLSRRYFLLRKPMMLMMVFTMYFSGGIIPEFLLFNQLGLLNTRLAVILPTAIVTWNLIILRTAFMQVPIELEESARLDGAGDITLLFNIIIPVSKASIAVITLFYVVMQWNAWFHAMVFLRNRALHPLQLVLRDMLILGQVDAGAELGALAAQHHDGVPMIFLEELMVYSAIIFAILPVVAVYPFAQKYFVKGIMLGSIKG